MPFVLGEWPVQQRAQRAVAEVSAGVASYGGIMKQRPGFGPGSVRPSRPSCCERASCQTWLLARPHLEPPRGRPSAAQKALRCESGKGFRVRFFVLIQSAPRRTFRLLTGKTSKIVHTIADLLKPASGRSREPPDPYRSRTEQPASSAYSDHTACFQTRDAVLHLALSVSSDLNVQTNTNTSLIADWCSPP